jgi:hypothetical protein
MTDAPGNNSVHTPINHPEIDPQPQDTTATRQTGKNKFTQATESKTKHRVHFAMQLTTPNRNDLITSIKRNSMIGTKNAMATPNIHHACSFYIHNGDSVSQLQYYNHYGQFLENITLHERQIDWPPNYCDYYHQIYPATQFIPVYTYWKRRLTRVHCCPAKLQHQYTKMYYRNHNINTTPSTRPSPRKTATYRRPANAASTLAKKQNIILIQYHKHINEENTRVSRYKRNSIYRQISA